MPRRLVGRLVGGFLGAALMFPLAGACSLRLAVAGFALVLAFASGWKLRGDHEKAGQLDAALAYAKAIRENQARADGLAADLEKARAARADKTRTLARQVPRYVEITPPSVRCSLPGNWRVLHDAAATGEPADTAGLASGTAAPVADASALETVADNYADCRDYAARLEGWQAWWRAFGAVKIP